MKLVIDTNIIVSGSLWHGAPARLLSAVLNGNTEWFLTLPLLLELLETLQRPKFAERLSGQGETPESLVQRFRAACVETAPAHVARPVELNDPDDVHVLACALAASADAIVTGDNDLLTLKSFEGIPIIRTAEALAMLGLD